MSENDYQDPASFAKELLKLIRTSGDDVVHERLRSAIAFRDYCVRKSAVQFYVCSKPAVCTSCQSCHGSCILPPDHTGICNTYCCHFGAPSP